MAIPEMIPVDSSNIEAVGYDDEQATLYVRFVEGKTYVYSDVSPETHQELMQADSKGSYFNREIRNVYDFHEE